MEFLLFLFGCSGSICFIFKNMKIQLYGSIFYMIANILSIIFFYSNNMHWLMLQNIIFLGISIAMFFNRFKKN